MILLIFFSVSNPVTYVHTSQNHTYINYTVLKLKICIKSDLIWVVHKIQPHYTRARLIWSWNVYIKVKNDTFYVLVRRCNISNYCPWRKTVDAPTTKSETTHRTLYVVEYFFITPPYQVSVYVCMFHMCITTIILRKEININVCPTLIKMYLLLPSFMFS